MTAGGSVVGSDGVGGAGIGPTEVTPAEVTPDDVARYYDLNTGRFLWMERGGVYGIHRELWGRDVTTAREAADHVNQLLAEELADLARSAEALVVDFGCGVGGTLFRLAELLPGARFHGVTISGRQHEIAERLAARLGLSARCSFTRADFHTVDLDVSADAVVAVESFAHSGAPAALLANVSRHLAPGGRLLVVDDFLARDERLMGTEERHLVERLRRAWRVPGIATVEWLERFAEAQGFVAEKDVDLTPLSRPGLRLRDRLVATLNPTLVRLDAELRLSRLPFFGNLIGGHAVQVGTREGVLQHRLLAFRKVA